MMPLCLGWGCRTFQTASHIHVIHIWEVWVPSQVVDGHMASHSYHDHHRYFPQICESCWLKSYLMQVRKPCHYALVETVEPFKLHPMSIPYIYERCEQFLRLWMGIWLCTHTITTILLINLLKWKNYNSVVLHSSFELSWLYAKMLWRMHRTHILPCSHQIMYGGNQ